MGEPGRSGGDVSEDGEVLVIEEELGRERIERRVGELLGGRDVNFGVFNAKVIAVNCKRSQSKAGQTLHRERFFRDFRHIFSKGSIVVSFSWRSRGEGQRGTAYT
jgi:hypothetical protein